MLDNRNSPASNDRLADEVKAAVLVALLGLFALGASDVLLARDDAPIAREVEVRATNREPTPYYFPGKFKLEATEIEPQAPTF